MKTVDTRLESALEQAGIPYQKRLQQAGTSVGYLVAGTIGVVVRAPCGTNPSVKITIGNHEINLPCKYHRTYLEEKNLVGYRDQQYDNLVMRAVEQIKTLIKSLMAMTL